MRRNNEIKLLEDINSPPKSYEGKKLKPIQRTTAAILIAMSGALAGFGIVKGAEAEQNKRDAVAQKILKERSNMTPEEAVAFNARQAVENAEMKAEYENATNPDELTGTLNDGELPKKGGGPAEETGLVEVGKLELSDIEGPGTAAGRMAGEGVNTEPTNKANGYVNPDPNAPTQ